jgi:hypothetical protein
MTATKVPQAWRAILDDEFRDFIRQRVQGDMRDVFHRHATVDLP